MALTGHRRWSWPNRLIALVGGAIALAQDVEDAQWVPAVMLVGLATQLIGTPVVDAAISRESERAADRYAVSLGAGQHLASALVAMGGNPDDRSRWWVGLRDGHPSTARRIEVLISWPEQPCRG